jgi:hypothetical protein
MQSEFTLNYLLGTIQCLLCSRKPENQYSQIYLEHNGERVLFLLLQLCSHTHVGGQTIC